MIKKFRFHSIDSTKDFTLMPEKGWQQDQLFEMLKDLDSKYPSLNTIRGFADKHGIRYQRENKKIAYCFITKNPSEAVVYFPDTEEKKEQTLNMLYKWRKDDLGTFGTVYAEDFARKHNIRFGIIEPM